MTVRTALLLMLAWLGSGEFSAGVAAVWRYDFDRAYQEAVQKQQPLLLHFYGQQCPPCRRMELEVFPAREVQQLLEQRYIAVKIDAGDPANVKAGQLVQRFGVHALPTDLVVDPLSGRVLSQTQGFQDLGRYLPTLANARSSFDRAHPPAVVKQDPHPGPTSSPNSMGRPGTTPVAGDGVTLDTPQAVVGLDGFSPVALGAYRKWISGKPEFAFEFKGMTYYLASAEELTAFRQQPDQFAPRLLGCDPVVLFETDRAVPGKTDFGAYFDGDLYLFESDESRRRFKANPPKFTRIQHVLKVDSIQKIAIDPVDQPAVK